MFCCAHPLGLCTARHRRSALRLAAVPLVIVLGAGLGGIGLPVVVPADATGSVYSLAVLEVHLETALLSPSREPQALAANALMLLREPAWRQALAQRGNEAIQRFTWSAAADSIERILPQASCG